MPYLVASPLGAAGSPRPLPFGLEVPPEHRFDPHRVASGPFLNVLQRLDELTFGPVGMPMPRWVFYDCAEVPGGIFGFARPAGRAPGWVRRALHVDEAYLAAAGPDALVPLSMFVAIPMLPDGTWHMYTLCSINEVAPGAGPAGLRILTAACGLAAFDVRTAYGAAQWRSSKLYPLACYGPLELVTAWTPAHSDPHTLTFRTAVTPDRIERALAGGPAAATTATATDRWVDCDDDAGLRALQAEIEAGRRLELVGAPRIDGSFTRVLVREAAPAVGP